MGGVRDFDVVRYDGNMASGLTDGRDVVWRDMSEPPFRLSGLPFHRPGSELRRLPELPEGAIPEAVDRLAWHTSGATLGLIFIPDKRGHLTCKAFEAASFCLIICGKKAFSGQPCEKTEAASG